MIRFTLVDEGRGRWVADDSVPNFPTRESYLELFEGNNLRAPEADSGCEQEDLDEQDEVLLAGGIKLYGNPSWGQRHDR